MGSAPSSTGEGHPPRRPGIPGRMLAMLALVVVTLVICGVAILTGWLSPDTLQQAVARSGSLGMVTYVVGIVVMELLWLPRMWGLFAGGLLFGPLAGGALSLLGDMGGAAICFMLARGAGRDWVSGTLEAHPRAARVVRLLADRRGGGTVAALRICPVAHFTLVSYAAGLTGVRPRSFLLGTAIGILPGAVLYPLVGDSMLKPTSPVFLASIGVMVVFLVVTMVAGRRVLGEKERP